MAYDPVAGELLDFFGGAEDLKNRVLRATSDAFAEDPLRVLRGMQFACRFDLTLDSGTAAMCQSIVDHYSTIAKERVAEEFMKWAVKSSRPGRIAEYLAASGWGVHFPEIGRLPGTRRMLTGTRRATWARTRCSLWMPPRISPRAKS